MKGKNRTSKRYRKKQQNVIDDKKLAKMEAAEARRKGLKPGGASGGEEGGGAPAPSLLDGMFPFLAIGLVLWFLIFAPEKKARKKRQEMLDAIKKGDRVVTTSGLHGEVMAVRADEIDLSAGGSKFTYSRAAVNEIID